MDYDNNSSSSSDEIYDNMMLDWVEESESLRLTEQAITYVVASTIQQNVPNRSSKKKRRKVVPRDREGANERLIRDYFCNQPLYDEGQFRQRFRMRKEVFLRITNALAASDSFFRPSEDSTGRLGASTLQKCTAAIRQLAYGTSADQVDEYLKLGASTARECLTHFVNGVTAQFSNDYLRRPTDEDLHRLLSEGERRGFPGMIGSIDCMHWQWKNCPVGWKGMYQGRSRTTTIILEAVASRDLWIWHAFFGIPGSCNDINVLQRSPVFDDILNGRAPNVTYIVNGNTYHMAYYLTDGIYPKWAAFVDAITAPQTPKQTMFTQRQESARKDVERAFGVLQARFAIIRQPALAWSIDLLWKIIMTCIIMHNMIVEDERDTYANYQDPSEFAQERPSNQGESSRTVVEPFTITRGRYEDRNLHNFFTRREDLHDRNIHMSLKNDLVDHIWNKFGVRHE
ncbi:uncharacterized protein LOC104906494 [Beta vulgaris subsp. vulgaris]|uniref:uncharacterized protein LOC104906494 n=1 Tax=Beta vulgaris subsp. vulgaris TaxID=3555 RepID=UPI00203696E7|nr:uncharacterized protein LOC104906494 [Beta vulgaris subsp. vulgaris]